MSCDRQDREKEKQTVRDRHTDRHTDTERKTDRERERLVGVHLCESFCVTGDDRTASTSCDRRDRRMASPQCESSCEQSARSCR